MFLAFMREKGGDTMARPSWRWQIALNFGNTWAVQVLSLAASMVVFCLVGRSGRSSRFRFIPHDINSLFGRCIPSGSTRGLAG
jgi:hypothetical protein